MHQNLYSNLDKSEGKRRKFISRTFSEMLYYVIDKEKTVLITALISFQAQGWHESINKIIRKCKLILSLKIFANLKKINLRQK